MKMPLRKFIDQIERVSNHDKEATIDFQATVTWAGAEVTWPPYGEILPEPPPVDRAKLWDSGVHLCHHVNIKPGQIYRHYKGVFAEVIGVGLREANAEPHVLYREVGRETLVFRPLKEWWQLVVADGGRVARFTLWANDLALANAAFPGLASQDLAALDNGPVPVGETP